MDHEHDDPLDMLEAVGVAVIAVFTLAWAALLVWLVFHFGS